MTHKAPAIRKVCNNINYLDRPMHLPVKTPENYYDDENGFIITAPTYGLPTLFDKKVLYILLHELQSNSDRVNGLTVHYNSAYEVLKKVGYSSASCKSMHRIDRLRLSLHIWLDVLFTYRECFRTDTGEYVTQDHRRVFDGLQEVTRNDPQWEGSYKFSVTFSPLFIESTLANFKVNFVLDDFLKIDNPTTSRLYEVLIKKKYALNTKAGWMCNITKLAKKLGLRDINDYRVDPKIQKAVEDLSRLDEFGDLYYKLLGTTAIFKYM